MALRERELKEINRHCSCGKPNFIFTKYYKWRRNDKCFLKSVGTFMFCRDPKCIYYFENFLKLNVIKQDAFLGDEFYFTTKGATLDNLLSV